MQEEIARDAVQAAMETQVRVERAHEIAVALAVSRDANAIAMYAAGPLVVSPPLTTKKASLFGRPSWKSALLIALAAASRTHTVHPKHGEGDVHDRDDAKRHVCGEATGPAKGGQPAERAWPRQDAGRSMALSFAGSAIRSIAAMWRRLTVNATTTGASPGVRTMTPAPPFTTIGSAKAANRGPVICSRRATASAPTIGGRASGPVPPPSLRKTTSGSRTASNPSKSPERAAARNASTTDRWRARSASGFGATRCTRRRARLASWRVASGVRLT